MSEAVAITPELTEWNLPSRRRVGIICLICTESALFLVFVIAYVFYIGKSLSGPTPRELLELPIPSTICLLSSSLTIVFAERGLRTGQRGTFNLFLFVTIALGSAFLAFTGYEWYDLIYLHNFTLQTNLFGTTFYSLVGLHATHVIVGLLLLTLILVFSLLGYPVAKHEGRVEAISWYWHFVDAVWVVVFTVVYVIGR